METNTPDVTIEAGNIGSAPTVVVGDGVTPTPASIVPDNPTEGEDLSITEDITGADPTESKGNSVKEIIRLRKRAQAAELENARLQGVLEGKDSLVTKPTAPVIPTPAPEKEPNPPDADQFEKYEDFEAAQSRYLIDRAKWEIKKEQKEEEERRKHETVATTWRQKVVKAQDKHPDFIQVVSNPLFKQSNVVAKLIQESDLGTDIAYHLGQNLQEAERLNSLPPYAAAKEIGKLEVKLSAPVNPTPEPRKLVTLAPDPINPIVPAGGGEVDEQDLPIDEFIKRRNKKEMEQRGRL